MPYAPRKDQFCISIDALQIQYTHAPIPAFDSVVFDLTELTLTTAQPDYKQGETTLTRLPETKDSNSAYFLHYAVTVSGKRIGTIDVNPVRATYAANLIRFCADNQLLYTTDLFPAINRFVADFRLVFHNYSKLDIAVDTTADIMRRFERCFFNADGYHFHRNKKQIDKLNAFSTIYRTKESNSTVYLAERVSGRSLKLYNKSIEILEESHKDYIAAYHTANGLDNDKDVWRLELSITNKAIKKYETLYRLKADDKITLTYYQYSKLPQTERVLYAAEGVHTDFEPVFEQLQDAEHLLSLFKHYSKGLAEFRKKGDSNISRCTTVPLIHLGENIKPLTAVEYITKTNQKELNTVKHNIKFQFEQFQKWNDTDYLTMAQKIARRNNLLDYYETIFNQYKSVISAYNHSVTNYKPTPVSLF